MNDKLSKFSLVPTHDWPAYDLKVTLKPSFRCNHNCWFCEEYNNNTKMWTKEQCDQVIDKLKDIPDSKRRLFFYFYGGEPTLNKYWEYVTQRLIETFPDRELFIQTQTNMSPTLKRLDNYLDHINQIKSKSHKIDICSSYHLGKQNVSEFLEKMKVCKTHGCLGLCFFSTEIPKHDQCIEEFQLLLDEYPNHIKLRFTETAGLELKSIPGYEKYLEDEYLRGDDGGKSLEFRYWLRKFPEWREYFETGWNFNVDDEIYNFSEVSGYNIHMKFKFMKCECGTKNMVIDHNLNVYHCNDDYNNQINITPLQAVNMSTYFSRPVRCLNSACYDGLDFKKYR